MKCKYDETLDLERKRLLERLRAGMGFCFQFASQEFRADREVALIAVNQWGNHLKIVSPDLPDDEEIVMAAVKGHNHCLEYASSRLQTHRGIVMAALYRDGYSLHFALTDLRADYDIVMEAVSQNGEALKFASSQLQGNHDIVLAAVNNKGYALKYASCKIRAERGIVLAAVNNNGVALVFATDSLKADRNLVFSAVRGRPPSFQYAASTLQADHDLVARAVSVGDRRVLHHVSKEIKGDLRDTVNKFDTYNGARDFLQGNLQIHAAFMELLCCVTSEAATVDGIPVTLLNLDRETSEKLHRHVAEYAGVPLGQRLVPVRLVKRVMPILETVYERRDENDQNLQSLLEFLL